MAPVVSAGVLGKLLRVKSESAPGDVADSGSSSLVWLLEATREGSPGDPTKWVLPMLPRVQEGRRVSRY